MTVYDLIRVQIQKKSDSIALEFGDKILTYTQLGMEVSRMTTYLKSCGVKNGDIVGISLNRSPEMIIALLAIIKTGAIYLPLDPAFPPNRLKYMLSDSSCSFLITENSLKELYIDYIGRIININECTENNADTIDEEIDDQNRVYILYTSGSTGNPKGVQIIHRSLNNFIFSMIKTPGFKPKDSLLAITTLSFDISGLEFYLPLVSGGKLIIATKEETKDGRLLLAKLRNVSVMQATPSTWKLILDSGWNEKLKLKALCGGEPLSRDLADRILERVDELWNMYGPTETTIWSSCSKVEKGNDIIHIGKPIDNTQFYIVDKNNQFCAPGVPGELLIGGDGLSIGYLNRDDLTNEKFITNPFDEEKKSIVYKTGDLVKLNSKNQIEFLGRIDNQVKVRGFRIELGEVENALRKIDNVKDAVVVVKDFGNLDNKLITYFIPESNNGDSGKAEPGSVENWKSKWDYIYNTTIDSHKVESNDFNLDFNITEVLTGNEEQLTAGFSEWLTQTLDRIKAFKPRRVLEIGCGAGQLLKEIAPFCDFYAATDFAESSIHILQSQVDKDSALKEKIKLLVKSAEEDLPFEQKSFDTVIVNSVAQYFPSLEYLYTVINKLTEFVSDGGCLYLGDIQSYGLLRNFHLNHQLDHLTENMTVATFKNLVELRTKNEEELVIDPDFFYAYRKHNPNISRIEVKLRRGKILNEITQYHYDAFLYVRKNFEHFPKTKELNWGKDITSSKKLEKILSKSKSEIFYLKNLPNKRISKNFEHEKLIYSAPANSIVTKLLTNLSIKDNSVDPEELWSLGKKYNFNTDVIIPINANQFFFDVVYYPDNDNTKYEIQNIENEFKELSYYANNPQASRKDQTIVTNIKNLLSKSLPDYMIPSFFIPVKEFPLTPNQKIDRKALSEFEIQDFVSKRGDRKPETEIEKKLVVIWEKLLGIMDIDTDSNFFELGGHSILAVQMFVEIEKEFGVQLPLNFLFEAQSVREFASLMSAYTKPVAV